MNESEFNALADQMLDRIEAALDRWDADLDCSRSGDGVLEIEFDDGGKIIVNRHVAAQEIWVAARSGGFHFRWDGAVWRDTRDASELIEALARLVSAQSGEAVSFD
ncbi:iron donor protein CyaY [uncultured Propionivibrio sp.]|uniref:iron donor protein CyaY n=1 Tax=uncultured Propionivibrio sp. TaxID=426737 RepID=UPI0029C0CDF7|nr:iron donor protein CyaY [uncultured Propionivibrio sp.]